MIQYPKTTHTTLPSVEGWSTNMNILRDPPKSLFTRRIDKVGQTQLITEQIDASGDRVCETINVYARGVNPMVSVQYGNNSSMNGHATNSSSAAQPYLPYRVMRDGAFRPPVLTERDLLPLSRLPRANVSVEPTASFADYSKKIQVPCADKLRQVRNQVLSAYARPTAVFKIETPVTAPYDTKNKIVQTPLQYTLESGLRTLERKDREVVEIDPRVLRERLAYEMETNKSQNINVTSLDELNDKQIRSRDISNYIVDTNKSQNINVTSLDELNDKQIRIRDISNYIVDTNKGSSYNKTSVEDMNDVQVKTKDPRYKDVEVNKGGGLTKDNTNRDCGYALERNIPTHIASTNSSSVQYVDISSRDVTLRPSLYKGGFENPGLVSTSQVTDHPDEVLQPARNTLAKRAFKEWEERHQKRDYLR